MESEKSLSLWRFGWHWLFAGLVVAGGVTLAAGYILSDNGGTASGWLLAGGACFASAAAVLGFAVLLLTNENIKSIKDNAEKLEAVAENVSRNRDLLGRIARTIPLSDSVKKIAFRDAERMELAEAVLGKLHQRDFEATKKMIEAITRQTEYGELAEQLTQRSEAFRNGTEEEQISQIVTHIEELCAQYHWAQANARITKLLNDFPNSTKAKSALEVFHQLKDKRKKELLRAWDEAVKLEETDRSLEILNELDLYLTPSEGLALQESASSVFRTKLHNLGVEFSVAVTEKNWQKALNAGQRIVGDFPNSKMAQEIRGKIDIFQQRAKKG